MERETTKLIYITNLFNIYKRFALLMSTYRHFVYEAYGIQPEIMLPIENIRRFDYVHIYVFLFIEDTLLSKIA